MSAAKLDNLLSIPASAIAVAAGSSLIGEAFGGPIGGIAFALGGAVVGVCVEVASQKRHRIGIKRVSASTET